MFKSARAETVVLLALFLAFGLPCEAQTPSSILSSQEAVEPVILTTTVVTDKGNLVTRLQRDNFRIFIDKVPADIIDFREEDVPLSVGIVFDASRSVGFTKWQPLIKSWQQALGTFLDTSNPANEYFFMVFNTSPQLLLDWTSDSKAIINNLGLVQSKGNTAFYDACYLAINKVRHGRYSKQVLILITDGRDNVSKYSLAQVRNELKASGVLVYSLSLAGSVFGGSALGRDSQHILDEFSSVSGGNAMTTSDATLAFQIVAQELRHQYTIAVKANVSSGKRDWHKIKVKVEAAANAPGEMKHLSARARAGFYLNHR